jgi:hypothetical protein
MLAAVFKNSGYPVGFKPVGVVKICGIGNKAVPVVPLQACLCACPHITGAILQHAPYNGVYQAVFGGNMAKDIFFVLAGCPEMGEKR